MDVGVVDVDATQERSLSRQFDVRGFPEMFVYRRDLEVFSKYRGGRTSGAIAQYMRHRVGGACQVFGEAPKAEDYVKFKGAEADTVLVRMWASPLGARDPYPPPPGSASVSRETLERAMEQMRDRVPCATPTSDTPPGLTHPFHVQLLHKFGQEPVSLVYSGADEVDALHRWVQQYSKPPVAALSQQNARQYVGEKNSGVAIVLLPTPVENREEDQANYYEVELRAVAAEVSDEQGPVVWLVYCRADTPMGKQLVDDYKTDPAQPTLVILDFTVRQRLPPGHVLADPFSRDAAVRHIKRFKAGELKVAPSIAERVMKTINSLADVVDDFIDWISANHMLVLGCMAPFLVAMLLFGFGGDKWLFGGGAGVGAPAGDSKKTK